VLRLVGSHLWTLDPMDWRVTNKFPVDELLACDISGNEVTIEVGGCGLCGLLRRQLHFLLASTAQASTVGAAVRGRLVRHLTAADFEQAKALAADAAVLSAAPREQIAQPTIAADPEQSLPTADAVAVAAAGADIRSLEASLSEPEDGLTFDVCVSIQKARSLPNPPTLCGGPIVKLYWGFGGPSSSRSAARMGGRAVARGMTPPDRLPVGGVSAAGSSHPGADEGGVGGDEDDGALRAPVQCATEPGEGDVCNPRWTYEVWASTV
jgi:hypothetical protein